MGIRRRRTAAPGGGRLMPGEITLWSLVRFLHVAEGRRRPARVVAMTSLGVSLLIVVPATSLVP